MDVEPVNSVSPVLKTKGLTKTYGQNRGIKNVDLTVT